MREYHQNKRLFLTICVELLLFYFFPETSERKNLPSEPQYSFWSQSQADRGSVANLGRHLLESYSLWSYSLELSRCKGTLFKPKEKSKPGSVQHLFFPFLCSFKLNSVAGSGIVVTSVSTINNKSKRKNTKQNKNQITKVDTRKTKS